MGTLRRLATILSPNMRLPWSRSVAGPSVYHRYFNTAVADKFGDDGEGDFFAISTEDGFYYRSSIPGLVEEDLKVSVCDCCLRITGKGGYLLQMLVPVTSSDQFKYEMKNEVLQLVIPATK